MNSNQLDPHISRLEYGNGCIRVDVGHGMDVNTANIRFTFTPSNAEAVTKVQAFIYDSCKSKFVDSEKVEEDYLQEDYLEADTGDLFELCFRKYQDIYSESLKDKVHSIHKEIEEISENQKLADITSSNKEKAERFDQIIDVILRKQNFDSQVPFMVSEERWEEQDHSRILREIYEILGYEITGEIGKQTPLSESEIEEKLEEMSEVVKDE